MEILIWLKFGLKYLKNMEEWKKFIWNLRQLWKI